MILSQEALHFHHLRDEEDLAADLVRSCWSYEKSLTLQIDQISLFGLLDVAFRLLDQKLDRVLHGLALLLLIILPLPLPNRNQMIEHLRDLFSHKRHRPGENIHEIRQQVGVLRVVELLDVESIVLELYEGALVVVDVAVVGCRENRDHCREVGLAVPLVHLVALDLGLVRADYGEQVVVIEKLVRGLKAKEVGAPAHLVLLEGDLLLALVIIHGVRPENIAEDPLSWWLLLTVQFVDVFQLRLGEKATFSRCGEIPPWSPMNLSLTTHAMEKRSKASMNMS